MTASDPRVELRKTLRVPKDEVFRAWTTPELMAQWMAPGPKSVLTSTVDLRVGGSYQIHMKGEMSGRAYDVRIRGTYERIVPNELLSFTWGYEDPERRKSVGTSVVTVLLKTVPEGTELTLIHSRIATEERRRGHLEGWTGSLEQLDHFLSQRGKGKEA
jgi:uncharacterized protein YndB with AHSA1/START domain